MAIPKHDLPAGGDHPYKRLQAVTPCVGYKDTDSGLVIMSPTAIDAGCTTTAMVRSPNQYAVQRNVVYWGVREPAVHEFDASISKNFALSERLRLQTRLDMFNALNHPNWIAGYNNDPTGKTSGRFRKGRKAQGHRRATCSSPRSSFGNC